MKFFHLFIFFFLLQELKAQKASVDSSKILDIEKGLTLSYLQGTYGFAEIGYTIIKYENDDRHGGFNFKTYSLEKSLKEPALVGFKYGIGGGPGLGFQLTLNTILYTNFQKYALVFQPQVGMGSDKFKLSYGYNATLINKNMENINRHLITVFYFKSLKSSRGF